MNRSVLTLLGVPTSRRAALQGAELAAAAAAPATPHSPGSRRSQRGGRGPPPEFPQVRGEGTGPGWGRAAPPPAGALSSSGRPPGAPGAGADPARQRGQLSVSGGQSASCRRYCLPSGGGGGGGGDASCGQERAHSRGRRGGRPGGRPRKLEPAPLRLADCEGDPQPTPKPEASACASFCFAFCTPSLPPAGISRTRLIPRDSRDPRGRKPASPSQRLSPSSLRVPSEAHSRAVSL